jgi:hypothetical protein
MRHAAGHRRRLETAGICWGSRSKWCTLILDTEKAEVVEDDRARVRPGARWPLPGRPAAR